MWTTPPPTGTPPSTVGQPGLNRLCLTTPDLDAAVAAAVAAGGSLAVSAPGILSNDADVDGNSLTASLVSGATHGALSVAADGSANERHHCLRSGWTATATRSPVSVSA